jgi:hypothetical protein
MSEKTRNSQSSAARHCESRRDDEAIHQNWRQTAGFVVSLTMTANAMATGTAIIPVLALRAQPQ